MFGSFRLHLEPQSSRPVCFRHYSLQDRIESFYARLCLLMSIYDLRKFEGPLSPRRLDAVSRAVLTLRLFRRVFGAQLSAIRVTEWRAA